MKNYSKYWFVSFVVLITLACINYLLFSDKDEQGTSLIELPEKISKHPEENTEQDVKMVKKTTESLYAENSDNVPFVNADKKNKSKMDYEEEWCDARNQLSESDYNFAKTELADWEEFIGKARAGKAKEPAAGESWFPNSNLIESYEALPLDQLQAVAMQEDKWAMVAFVQNKQANNELKDKVAKTLLVRGASYYAIEHLVKRSLVAARISINIHNDVDAGAGHVVDALVYAYWGLEHYSDSGLGSFNGITANEPFKTKLPIELVLKSSEKLINTKLEAFSRQIDQKRADMGIDMPSAPQAVKKMFAQNIAVRQVLAKQQFELLRNLNISHSNRLEITPCVAWYMADLEEKMQ